MPITLDGTNGITTPTYGGADTSEYLVPVTQFKNRIINGAMQIDQRNAGASVTLGSGAVYCLDRWAVFSQAASKFTVQQDAGGITPPAGFTDYLGLTVASAVSLASTDQYMLQQRIEGFNVADLGFGTANAKTVTLSFWVRSSLTGTFGGVISNSAENRSYPFTYTISAANTWEQKSVTIAGDTTGTWLTNNGVGLWLKLNLGTGATYSGTAGAWSSTAYLSSVTGSVNVVSTNGATFYITGVQLEVGSTATSFDYRPYGTELQLCQRYCYAIKASEAVGSYSTFSQTAAYTSTALSGNFIPKVTMRAVPTLSTTGTASNYMAFNGTFYTLNSVPAITTDSTPSSFTVDASVGSGLTAGYSYRLLANNNNVAYLIFSAEL